MAKKRKVTTTVTTTVTEEVVSSNEKTQIVCILDRSGSMADKNIIVEAINGFNTFLDEQKKLKDDATLTVALFDDRYDLLYDNVDIKKVEKITKDTWSPRGMTALFDAIGKTITTVRANHTKLGSEKPSKVLVCIVTDGLENASQEYTKSGVAKLIKECENEDWNFVYLAANQNAFSVGTGFGISGGNTYTFDASAAGAQNMSFTLNNASVSYRSMSRSDIDYDKKSKNLIGNPDDDKNEPEDNNSGTITTNNTGGNFTIK